jgi:hypothetical protein
MNGMQEEFADYDNANAKGLPIWLYPITQAAQRASEGIVVGPTYDKLHSLALNMQWVYTPEMAYLFALPNLRRLSLRCMLWSSNQVPPPWPIAPGSSGVHTLEMNAVDLPEGVIVHMIKSCKALSYFECEHFDPILDWESYFSWWSPIKAALEIHTASLKTISLKLC